MLATHETRSERLTQLKVQLHKKLIAGMDMKVLHAISHDVLVSQLREAAVELCQSHRDLLSRSERDQLIDELVDETIGLGPLEPLIKDPTISDILINGPDTIYVERRGKLERAKATFRDLDHLIEVIQRIVGRVGRRIDESSPMVDARLPDGSRLNAVVRPLALQGALVSIRRFSHRPLTVADLLRQRSAGREMLAFLAACVEAGLNIIISGGTGAGKTTLLNALSKFIPPGERIVTIEDAAELQLQQPHVAKMETRPPNLDGKGEVTTCDLLRNALRMRPDRIVIGECRGREAFDMLQAMNTGHDGGLTTVHANAAREALSRLVLLAGMAAPELPTSILQQQIASAIDLIVQVSRLPCGSRKITQIAEITGRHGDSINLHDIFVWRQEGVDDGGQATGSFVSCGIVPNCLERIRRKGLAVPTSIFSEGPMSHQRVDQLWGSFPK